MGDICAGVHNGRWAMGVGRWKNSHHVRCVWRCIGCVCLATGPLPVYNSRDAIFSGELAFHPDTLSVIRRHGC